MKQRNFEMRHQSTWHALATCLKRLEGGKPHKAGPTPLAVAELPATYRQLAQQLAVARQRGYSGALLGFLNQLALRAYQQIYRAPQYRWSAVLQFLSTEFPQQVRTDIRFFWLCAALFYVPLIGMGWVVYHSPELIYTLLSPSMVADLESMYHPDSGQIARNAGSDVAMFGHYVQNNIGLGFRTFAGGILFGVGAIFTLVLNGFVIGAISGYLTAQGFIGTFYSFVSGHGAFELTGVVLAGTAGLKLGWAIVAPGRLSRAHALRQAAYEGVRLVIGMAVLLLLAAFIEAFWSGNPAIPSAVKYGFGATAWLSIILYLSLAGRRATRRINR